jgi:hypothetical protein
MSIGRRYGGAICPSSRLPYLTGTRQVGIYHRTRETRRPGIDLAEESRTGAPPRPKALARGRYPGRRRRSTPEAPRHERRPARRPYRSRRRAPSARPTTSTVSPPTRPTTADRARHVADPGSGPSYEHTEAARARDNAQLRADAVVKGYARPCAVLRVAHAHHGRRPARPPARACAASARPTMTRVAAPAVSDAERPRGAGAVRPVRRPWPRARRRARAAGRGGAQAPGRGRAADGGADP